MSKVFGSKKKEGYAKDKIKIKVCVNI